MFLDILKNEDSSIISIKNIPKISKSFVYFLIEKGNIVYVGQTTQGLSRPFHHTDKSFDEVRMVEVPSDMLDTFEKFYILKYSPRYNKDLNQRIGLKEAKGIIRLYCKNESYNLKDLKQDITKLKISINHTESKTGWINPKDMFKIVSCYLSD